MAGSCDRLRRHSFGPTGNYSNKAAVRPHQLTFEPGSAQQFDDFVHALLAESGCPIEWKVRFNFNLAGRNGGEPHSPTLSKATEFRRGRATALHCARCGGARVVTLSMTTCITWCAIWVDWR
jgi:hypothetical protein